MYFYTITDAYCDVSGITVFWHYDPPSLGLRNVGYYMKYTTNCFLT